MRGAALVLLVGAIGCGGGSDAGTAGSGDGSSGAETDARAEAPSDTEASSGTRDAPPPWEVDDPAAFRAFLDVSGYPDDWYLWPGTGVGDSIAEPHGPRGMTRINFLAQDAITNGAAGFSAGATLVLQGLDVAGNATGLVAMVKRGDPATGEGTWYWVSLGPEGAVLAEGRPEGCVSCHAEGRDHVLTAEMGTDEVLDPRE